MSGFTIFLAIFMLAGIVLETHPALIVFFLIVGIIGVLSYFLLKIYFKFYYMIPDKPECKYGIRSIVGYMVWIFIFFGMASLMMRAGS